MANHIGGGGAVLRVSPERVGPLAPAHVGHVPALDGIRGLAIVSVMLAHWAPQFPTGTVETYLWDFPNRFGVLGVDLFFVLSGFLITGILLDTKGSPGWVAKFYVRRILRIFPLYFGFLALMFFVLLPAYEALKPSEAAQFRELAPWYWTYSVNIPTALDGTRPPFFTLHLWSLSVEEQFYFLWPWLVLALSRGRLMGACAALLVGGVALRLAGSLGWTPWLRNPYPFTLTHMDGVLAGSFLAALLRGPKGWGVLTAAERLRRPILYGGALAVALRYTWGLPRIVGVLLPTLDAFVFALLVAYGVTAGEGRARLLRHPAMRTFGIYAYGLYMVHYPLLFWARPFGWLGSSIAGQVAYVGLGFALSFLLAVPLWHFFEQPILRLKRFFDYRPRET